MRSIRPIFFVGLITGTLDIAAAIVQSLLDNRSVLGLFQSIASGLLGRTAFNGGLETAAIGLFLHFTIATSATAVYYGIVWKAPFLGRPILVSGAMFGLIVYAVMNSIIVPLTAAPFQIPYTWSGALIHIIFVGLPISILTTRLRNSRLKSTPTVDSGRINRV